MPRKGLQIRRVGRDGDLIDEYGQIGKAYDLVPGDWVLIRPDGYVGAIVDSSQAKRLDDFLLRMGL